MKIAGLQKLTLLDYPEHLAATIFTPGCDLRCPFCHNSEIVLNPNESYYSEEKILDFLRSRKGKLSGLAITGGEPLVQADIEEFIAKVKEAGFKVKLDTNGTYPEKLKSIVDKRLVDYIAMDIKNSREKWSETTGIPGTNGQKLFEKTLESMEIIKGSGIDYEFRTTIVKGLHSLSDMDGLGSLVAGCKRYFLQSYVDSGHILEGGFGAWDEKSLNEMLEVIRKYVPNAQLRGVD